MLQERHWYQYGTSMILLIGGEKGGTGKSTVATNLAVVLASRGVDVVLLDTDPQATAARWAERRNDTDLATVHCVQRSGSLYEAAKDLATRYQQVIIDAGGRDSRELRTAMAAADKMYVPLRPSQPDIETSVHLDELVALACDLNPRLEARALLSMAPTHHSVTEAEDAKELLSELPHLKLSDVIIRTRKVYRDAMAEGKGVVELENAKAKSALLALTKEIYSGEVEV